MIRRNGELSVEKKENMRGGTGTVTLTNILNEDEFMGKGRLFATLRFPAGASIGRHTHEGEAECYYVLSGVGAYEDNGEWTTLGPGDMARTPSGEHHCLKNEGSEDLVVLALILHA